MGWVHCSVCREQWIRAKYDRKEFLSDKTDESIPYITGELAGLWCNNEGVKRRV